jgi:DNA-binding NtrC family response regulator
VSALVRKAIVLLIVDDERDLRDMISNWLELEGFEIHSAGGGTEAFVLFERQHIDAVISDIRMPEGDGVELLKQIRRRHAGTPVVMISGFSDFTNEQLTSFGADCVLIKPFPMSDLSDVVHRLTATGAAAGHR